MYSPDWERAPEGATFYNTKSERWYKIEVRVNSAKGYVPILKAYHTHHGGTWDTSILQLHPNRYMLPRPNLNIVVINLNGQGMHALWVAYGGHTPINFNSKHPYYLKIEPDNRLLWGVMDDGYKIDRFVGVHIINWETIDV